MPRDYAGIVPSLDDIARHQTSLSNVDVQWLHALVADWQILADLSFSDLVLWVPDVTAKGMWAGAQIRPTTGPTSLLEDVVGTFVPSGRTEVFERSLSTGSVVSDQPDTLPDGSAVRVEVIPVVRAGSTVAVVARRRKESGHRTASALEEAYLESAADLVGMIRRGEFPVPGERSDLADSLRVGDGFVRTDVNSVVRFASPNAMSAYRRLGLGGDLVGTDLASVTQELLGRRPIDMAARALLATDATTEIETDIASLLLRVIPLRVGASRHGSVILLRDVTELRLRERELVSKEATIREIHHRVKNNLQTVAALLRLQARRMDIPEARTALEEAERRVGSIALVHETLSQSFDESVAFDEIADRLLSTVLEVAGAGTIVAHRVGSFGTLSGEVATPLAMVLTELIQNAAEHAFGESGGRLNIAVNRIRDRVRLRISDDGVGLPDDFTPTNSLGLSIVSTLVETELGGTLRFEKGSPVGTTVLIELVV